MLTFWWKSLPVNSEVLVHLKNIESPERAVASDKLNKCIVDKSLITAVRIVLIFTL